MSDAGPAQTYACPHCGYDVTDQLARGLRVCSECSGAISEETCVRPPGGLTRRDLTILAIIAFCCALLGAALYLLVRIHPDTGRAAFLGVPGGFRGLFVPMNPPLALGYVIVMGAMYPPFFIAHGIVSDRVRRRVGRKPTRLTVLASGLAGFVLILGTYVMTIALLQ